MRPAVLLLALLLVAPACGRKKPPPPTGTGSTTTAEAPKPNPLPVPKGVPAELKNLVEKEWPAIVKDGNAFLDKYKEFQSAQGSGDRAAMATLGEQANQLFERANEKWAEIYYWVDNALGDGVIDEDTAEVCRKYLADPYNKQVTEWTKKNKVLKEFSTAK
jgi:hypothetical protein